MDQFIESLKRLYEKKVITEERIAEMCKKGTISNEDKKYILRKE